MITLTTPQTKIIDKAQIASLTINYLDNKINLVVNSGYLDENNNLQSQETKTFELKITDLGDISYLLTAAEKYLVNNKLY